MTKFAPRRIKLHRQTEEPGNWTITDADGGPIEGVAEIDWHIDFNSRVPKVTLTILGAFVDFDPGPPWP